MQHSNFLDTPLGIRMPISNRPLYMQVRDALADLISLGRWKPGFQLPGEGELAREVGVSSGTVRKALELMESQGLINRRQGYGSFVSNPGLDELADRYVKLYDSDGTRLRGEQVKTVKLGQFTADSSERGQLQLRPGVDVYRIRRVRQHLGESFLLEDVVLPAERFPGLLDGADVPQEIGILAHQYGILLGKAEERISIGAPSRDVAEMLHASPDEATMRLDRIVMTLDRQPVEWRIAYCRTQHGYYVVEIK